MSKHLKTQHKRAGIKMLRNPASIFDSVVMTTLPTLALKANQPVELLEVTPRAMHTFAQTQCIAHDCSLLRSVWSNQERRKNFSSFNLPHCSRSIRTKHGLATCVLCKLHACKPMIANSSLLLVSTDIDFCHLGCSYKCYSHT